MKHLANILTASRLLLAPVFIVLFLIYGTWAAACALALASFFELTDMLDGYVARHISGVSSLGKLIDPLADSVARFSIFLAFTTDRSVRGDFWPILLVAAIFYRDAIVSCMRTLAAASGFVMAARISGKIKAVVQGTGIIIFLLVRLIYFIVPDADVNMLRMTFYYVMVPVAAVTLLSGCDYVISNRNLIIAQIKNRDDRGQK